jgi:invasion protein IalB
MRTADGSDPCQLYQLLKDAQGTSVAEISLFPLPPGQQAIAGATIVAPLETLLTEQLTLAVDGATPKRYPFTWCAPLGCIARVGFTQAEIDGFKKGAKATMTIVPVAAPDQKVVLDISLKGFTAGFDAVAKTPAP